VKWNRPIKAELPGKKKPRPKRWARFWTRIRRRLLSSMLEMSSGLRESERLRFGSNRATYMW
jgi:hypothetical protein